MQSCEMRKVARPLTAVMRSYDFMVVSIVPVREMAEALFIKISIPPNVSIVALIASRILGSLRMSTLRGNARPPSASISLAALKIVPGSIGCGFVVLAQMTILALK